VAFKKGQGGRPKGVPNKSTKIAKEAIEGCFEGMGGLAKFQEWARANPTDFYTKVYVKVLPLQIGAGDSGLKKLVIEWQQEPSSE